MLKLAAAALAAVGLMLGAAAPPADAQAKPKVVAKKKVLVKKAAPKSGGVVVKYTRKCKPGQAWNATASLNSGACEKVAYKAKRKAKSKVARAPRAVVKPKKA